jgi:hypothetical protein
MIQDSIIKWAKLFNGIKEIGNNNGWETVFFKDVNMTFQEIMITIGWKNTHAWCAYFAEAVWTLAYSDFDSTMVKKLSKLFSANAVETYNRFSRSSEFECSKEPKIGSLVIWQKYVDGNPTIYGHEGVVIGLSDNHYRTIEGNTNISGSRDGDQVAERTVLKKNKFKENGLNLLGFVHPKEV